MHEDGHWDEAKRRRVELAADLLVDGLLAPNVERHILIETGTLPLMQSEEVPLIFVHVREIFVVNTHELGVSRLYCTIHSRALHE